MEQTADTLTLTGLDIADIRRGLTMLHDEEQYKLRRGEIHGVKLSRLVALERALRQVADRAEDANQTIIVTL